MLDAFRRINSEHFDRGSPLCGQLHVEVLLRFREAGNIRKADSRVVVPILA
jgi:hypothetical protein